MNETPKTPKPTTVDQVQRALDDRAKADAKLKQALRGLPQGSPRRHAVRACKATGMKNAEVARFMGITPVRVGQMLAEDDCSF